MIFSITIASVMQAIILTLCFVQFSHCVMSILNTLLNRCAQLMRRAWYGVSVPLSALSSLGLFLPRFDAVTSAQIDALRKKPIKTNQVESRRGHQSSELTHKV